MVGGKESMRLGFWMCFVLAVVFAVLALLFGLGRIRIRIQFDSAKRAGEVRQSMDRERYAEFSFHVGSRHAGGSGRLPFYIGLFCGGSLCCVDRAVFPGGTSGCTEGV